MKIVIKGHRWNPLNVIGRKARVALVNVEPHPTLVDTADSTDERPTTADMVIDLTESVSRSHLLSQVNSADSFEASFDDSAPEAGAEWTFWHGGRQTRLHDCAPTVVR